MKPLHSWGLALALAGCGLVNSNTLSYDYSFDPQQFMETLGDPNNMATVPMVPCDPTAGSDQCAQLQSSLPPGTSATLSCDAPTRMCAAVVDVHLGYPVDLSQQMLPSPVVQYGIDKVSIKKIAYWLTKSSVNVEVPPIDLYVASSAAKDLSTPSARLVGTVSKVPPRSACTDPADTQDPVENSVPVCDIPLNPTGQAALAAFVKDYKTPFQFIAHTKLVAHGGEPLPTGVIAFDVRPTVSFSVLK
jgi:hypothetical protein